MPRGNSGGSGRRNARVFNGTAALRLERLHRETVDIRRVERARKRAAAQRSAVNGWDGLRARMEKLDIQAEIDVMELRIVNAERAEMDLKPLTELPHDGGLGDTRHPADDYRNYQ